jgi:phosphoenolpyruvate synthase/pyruvate phosphate dikinase
MLTNLLPFHELDEHDIGTIGGKAVNLSRMIRDGFPVPMGFVVPVGAYDAFFEHNNLSAAIADILDDTDFTDEGSVRASAERIKSYIGEGC